MQGMPAAEGGRGVLRRHGDMVQRLPGGLYAALGRSDDTMNLGGIKVPCFVLCTDTTLRRCCAATMSDY